MTLPQIKTKPCPSTRSGKYHIVDGKKPVRFHVTPADLRGSKVGDPHQCAGACALRRVTGAEVWVKRSITYLAYPNRKVNGKIYAVRYMNPRRLSNAVDHFDRTAGLFPPGLYELKVPRGTQTMTAILAYNSSPQKQRSLADPKRKIIQRKRPTFYLR